MLFVQFILLAFLFVIGQTSDSCEPISQSSVCKHILDYDHVSVPDGSCQEKFENEVEFVPMTIALFEKDSCKQAVAVWICSRTFPRCGNRSLEKPCSSLMQRVLDECDDGSPVLLKLTKVEWDVVKDLEESSNNTSTTPCNQPKNQSFSPIIHYPRCETYKGTFCGGIVDYPVYVPAGFTQNALEEQISDTGLLLPFADNHQCLNGLLDLVCSMTFMPCVSVFMAELPRFPCHSLCSSTMHHCTSMIASDPKFSSLKINCSALGTLLAPPEKTICGEFVSAAQPDFPVQKYVFKSVEEAGIEVSSTCNPGAVDKLEQGGRTAPVDVHSLVSCPYPLIKVPVGRGLSGGSCKDPCPSFVVTSSEWDKAEIIFAIFAPLSFICSVFLFLTWVIFPSSRKHSGIFFIVTNVMIIAIAELMGWIFSRNSQLRNVGCINEVTPSQEGFCFAQASVFFYCANSTIAWWFLQAVDLYRSVVLQKMKTLNRTKDMLFYMWGFGWPFLANVIMWILGAFGGTGASPWCFVVPEFHDWEWALCHYPVLGQGLIVCYIMSRVMFSLWMSFKKTAHMRKRKRGSKNTQSKSSEKSSEKRGLGGMLRSSGTTGSNNGLPRISTRLPDKILDLQYFLRPIFFVCIFWILFVSFSSFVAITYVNQDAYIASATEFVTCLFNGGRATSDSCGVAPAIRQPMGFWYFLLFIGSCQGFVIFVLYGTIPRNLSLWKGLFHGHGLEGFKNSKEQIPNTGSSPRPTDRGSTPNLSGRPTPNHSKPGTPVATPRGTKRMLPNKNFGIPSNLPINLEVEGKISLCMVSDKQDSQTVTIGPAPPVPNRQGKRNLTNTIEQSVERQSN